MTLCQILSSTYCHNDVSILKVPFEIPAVEFKLTANKSYRSTGVSTVGDRLEAGVKSRQGMNGHVFF
jgi:hypothetical protein